MKKIFVIALLIFISNTSKPDYKGIMEKNTTKKNPFFKKFLFFINLELFEIKQSLKQYEQGKYK